MWITLITFVLTCVLHSLHANQNFPSLPSARTESRRSPEYWMQWFDNLDNQNNSTVPEFNCNKKGHFPHPKLCNRYFVCDITEDSNDEFPKYRKREFLCQAGTLFDIIHSHCIDARNATSIKKCEFETDTQADPEDPYNDSFPTAGYETNEYCIYDIRVYYIYGFPDGVLKRMISFNGHFPGPTIRCTREKWLVIRVTNSIDGDEPTSIHWHGLEQRHSPFFDGPEYVTQCPIIRGTYMIYKFQLLQSGTYWYHTHHTYQYVDGAWGFLIARNTPTEIWGNAYDAEALISVNDWNHTPARNLSEIFLTQGIFPATESSLINGRGIFQCENINVTAGQVCDPNLQKPAVVNVIRGKVYRLRILNSSGARAYNFSIDGHKLVVIETDGVDTVQSPAVDIVPVLPAQRYSLLVTMSGLQNEYWIRASSGTAAGLNAKAILRYIQDHVEDIDELDEEVEEDDEELRRIQPRKIARNKRQAQASPLNAPPSRPRQGRPHRVDFQWDDIIASGGISPPTTVELQSYFSSALPRIKKHQIDIDIAHSKEVGNIRLPSTLPPDSSTATLLNEQDCPPFGTNVSAPATYDTLITLVIEDCPIDGAPSRLCVNGTPFTRGGTSSLPVLFQAIRNVTISQMANPYYLPNLGRVVRIVINNHHATQHPMHLHGHSFYVLGTGPAGAGDFNITRDGPTLTTHGVRRDTAVNLGNSWSVFEFISDNPGTWVFHCHINWHFEAGLAVTFIEAEEIVQQVYREVPLQAVLTCARVGVVVF